MNCLLHCEFIHRFNPRHTHIHTRIPTLHQSTRFSLIFIASDHLSAFTHTHTPSAACVFSLLTLSHTLTHTNVHTHRCLREKKPTELEKRLSQDERLHTHCLHAEPLPTPSRDSAHCSRGLCYADTLQLASLPTPISTATHLHLSLFLTPSVAFLSSSLSTEL